MIIRKGCPASFVDVGKVYFINLDNFIEESIVILSLLRIGNTYKRISIGNAEAERMKEVP